MLAMLQTEHRIPKSDLGHDFRSFDTKTNWQEALSYLSKRGYRNITLVSSALHLARISKLVDTAGRNNLTITLSPSKPEPSLLARWHAVNHEFLAILAMNVLPDEYYVQILKVLRHRWELL